MAGRIEAVYIKIDEGILVKAEPNVNIPESLEKFCAMMCKSFSYKFNQLLIN